MATDMNEEQQKVTKAFEEQYSKADRRTQEAVDYNIMTTLDKLNANKATDAQIKLALSKVMADQTLAMKENTVVMSNNALTPSVNNYAPDNNVNRTSLTAATTPNLTDSTNYTLQNNYGLDAAKVGLDRLSLNTSLTTNHNGDLSGSAEIRGVKALPEALQPQGATLFVAGGIGANIDAKNVTPTATLLGVAASDINGVPVGGFAGGVANLDTGKITKVVQGEATINADTPYATTFGLGATTGNFTAATTNANLTAYQKYYGAFTGLKLAAPVNELENTAVMLEVGIQR